MELLRIDLECVFDLHKKVSVGLHVLAKNVAFIEFHLSELGLELATLVGSLVRNNVDCCNLVLVSSESCFQLDALLCQQVLLLDVLGYLLVDICKEV